jgi:hypothetical protein
MHSAAPAASAISHLDVSAAATIGAGNVIAAASRISDSPSPPKPMMSTLASLGGGWSICNALYAVRLEQASVHA